MSRVPIKNKINYTVCMPRHQKKVTWHVTSLENAQSTGLGGIPKQKKITRIESKKKKFNFIYIFILWKE